MSTAVIVATSVASLAPFFIYWEKFTNLYWFSDDWDLLDGAASLGLSQWLLEPFLKESVIPLFKLLWLAAVELFEGSYLAMLGLVWATHLAILLLFGFLLRRSGFSPAAIACVVLTLGLAWTNIETLGWAAQWSPQLALLFFLIAWHWQWRLVERPAAPLETAGLALCVLASALSSSRGIISGLLVALFAVQRRRYLLAVVSLAPSVLVALVQVLWASRAGEPHAAAVYAACYWLLNPLYLLLPIPKKAVDTQALILCGALKALFLACGLRRDRPLLVTLAAFDLLNAVALGWARYHTGLATTVSSRYQYISLFCFGPLVASALARFRLPRPIIVVAFVAWVGLLVYPWKRHADRWSRCRGAEVRAALASAAPNQRFGPALITAARARELVRGYRLH